MTRGWARILIRANGKGSDGQGAAINEQITRSSSQDKRAVVWLRLNKKGANNFSVKDGFFANKRESHGESTSEGESENAWAGKGVGERVCACVYV